MRRDWAMAVAAVAVLMLGACTGEGPPGVPTAGDTPKAAPSSAAVATDAVSRELQFVACMRQQGITDMPDPIPGDKSGRSSVRYALDVLGKGSDPAFQAALDKCTSFLPAPEPEKPASTQDMQRYIDFAKCMREHGAADFPDPHQGPDGRIYFAITNSSGAIATITDGRDAFAADPTLASAATACKGMLPATGTSGSPGTG